jgi:hypothetical protein
MFSAFFLSVALLGADDPPADAKTSAKPPLEAYREASAKTGKSADAHIRLALWCEAHGLTAERLKHLSLAVLYDPSNALARGLMGLVAFHGKWDRPEIVGKEIQNDPAHQAIVKDYLARRARTPDTAEAQMKLAAWCEEHGLKEQAIAHYNAVTRIDPPRDAAWKHLGYKKQGSRWVKPEEAQAAKQEAARQKHADKHWKPILEKLRNELESKDAAKRAKAEQELTTVTDPLAVSMIWGIFGHGNERLQLAGVRMLAQIDGPSASNALAGFAVFSPLGSVRARAIEFLKRRDPRDVVGRLIGLIHKPFKYQVRHVNGPGSPGELFVEGERFNIDRFYRNLTSIPNIAQFRFYTPDVPFDPFSSWNVMTAMLSSQFAMAPGNTAGLIGMGGNMFGAMPGFGPSQGVTQVAQAMAANPHNASAILNHLATNRGNGAANAGLGSMLELDSLASQRDMQLGMQLLAVQQANRNLEQMLAMDVQFLDTANATINRYDDRTLPVLTGITGQDFGVEPEKWKSWWIDRLGYVFQSSIPETKPTYTDVVTDGIPTLPPGVHSACFAAGTIVQTIDGPQAIESIRVGDRVLSQGTTTGQLAFQPVIATHRTPSNPTLRIAVGDETVVATGIHRFWKAGTGWTMARDLKAGDRLRIVGGTIDIRSIETDKVQPVYNLDVAENRDFFVGATELLVHDFTFVQPVLQPFDRTPELGSPAPSLK